MSAVVIGLASVGAVTLVVVLTDSLWSILQMVSANLMPFFLPKEVQALAKKYGPWAVVTGSTDGIGKQYALELARHGLNIVLIARNNSKLRDVAGEIDPPLNPVDHLPLSEQEEIEKTYSVKTKIIQADFSEGEKIYDYIEAELQSIPLGILVNNVGCQYEYPMPLNEVPTRTIWNLINVNVGATTLMTRMLLPRLVEQGRGAVVNVSSGSELQPLPLMTVYASTKAYVGSFTAAIRHEYGGRNITIQHLSPLFVSTKINAFSEKLLEGNLLVPDAKTYARHAVATLGKVDKTTGYWIHGIQYFFTQLPPVWLRTKIGALMNQRFREEYFHNHHRVKSS